MWKSRGKFGKSFAKQDFAPCGGPGIPDIPGAPQKTAHETALPLAEEEHRTTEIHEAETLGLNLAFVARHHLGIGHELEAGLS